MEEDNKPDMIEQGAKNVGNSIKNNAKQAVKSAAKQAIKKVAATLAHAIISLIATLLPYIAIIVAVVVIITGFEYVLEIFAAEDTTNEVYSAVIGEFNVLDGLEGQNALEVGDIANIVEIKQDSQGYHLEFVDGFDEKVENAVKKVNESNTTIRLKDAESLKKFILAEAKTKYPNLGGETDGDKMFQGSITIKRFTPDKNPGEVKETSQKETILKYVDSSTFDGYVSNNNPEALNVFTFDNEKNIITATWSNANGSTTIEKNSSMNYRNATSAYTMPFEYLLFLLIDGESEEFCNELADLAMNSTMEIAVVDDVTNTKTTTTTVYRKWEEDNAYTQTTDSEGNTQNNFSGRNIRTLENSSNDTVNNNESVNSRILLSKVDSWALKQENKISLKTDSSTNDSGFKKVSENRNHVYTSDASDGISHVVFVCDETYSKTVIETSSNTFSVDEAEMEENTEKFVELYKKYEKTLNNNLIPSWLFEMMRKNGKTSNLIEITKLLLYEATGRDYGVTDFKDVDFSDMLDLTNATENSIENDGNIQLIYDYIALHENGYTYKYLNTHDYDDQYDTALYVKESVTRDKKYYKCKYDGDWDNGTRNFGYGVLHYTNGTNGYPLSFGNQRFYSEVGVNIEQEKYTQTYNENNESVMPVEIVDYVCKRIIEENRETLQEEATKVGVTLNDDELNAMCYMLHKYGPGEASNIMSYYKQYGNTEAFRQNYKAFHIAGMQDWCDQLWNVFHNGIYWDGIDNKEIDKSKYLNNGSASGDAIVAKAVEIMDYMMKNGFYYANGNFVPKSKQLAANKKCCDCSAFVCWVLYEVGYTNAQYNGWQLTTYTMDSNGKGYFPDNGWQKVTDYNNMQPGDIVIMSGEGNPNGHVQIFAYKENGVNYYINCGWDPYKHTSVYETYCTQIYSVWRAPNN